MKQKGFAPVLIILIVVILGVVGYFGNKYFKLNSPSIGQPSNQPSSSPAPSANWKTYTNSKYNYTLKLPVEWGVCFLKTCKYGDKNTLNVFQRDWGNYSLTIFVEKAGTQEAGSEGYIFGDQTIGSRKITSSFKNRHDLVIVKTKSFDFVIDFEFEMGDEANAKILFDQILSTFKFTDQITPSPSCVPLPSCAYSQNPNVPVCKIGEKPSSGGTWCPRYSCPTTEWVNCQPGDAPKPPQCSPDAMAWYKANCPNFKGGAY